MKNNDELVASDRNSGLLEAGCLGQAQAPCLKAREATGSGQQGRGHLVQALSCHPVPMLRDAPVPAELAGRFRRKSGVGMKD